MYRKVKLFLLMFIFSGVVLLLAGINVKANEQLHNIVVESYEMTEEGPPELLESAAKVMLESTYYSNTNDIELDNVPEGLVFSFFEEKGFLLTNTIDNRYLFRVTEDHQFKAYFRNQNKAHVVVVDANNKVLGQRIYEMGTIIESNSLDEFKVSLNNIPGYTFLKWNYDFTKGLNGLTIIRAVYESDEVYFTVNVNNGELVQNEILYGKTLSVEALETKGNMYFSHWTINGVVASYKRVYTFSVYEDCDVVAVYSENMPAVNTFAYLSHNVIDNGEKKIFIAQTYSNQEIVERGMIFLESDNEVIDFDFGTEGIKRVRALRVSQNDEFSVSKVYDNSKNLYVKSYIVVENGNEFETIYSEIIEIKKEINALTVLDAREAAIDEIVVVRGIVTSIIGNNAFIQDETAGIYVYLGGNTSFADKLLVGNDVILSGKRAVFNGLVQLSSVTFVEVIKTNVALPAVETFEELVLADLLTAEGKLVTIEGLKTKSIPTIETGAYSVIVTDGVTDLEIRIDQYIAQYAEVKALFESMIVGQGIDFVQVPVGRFNANPQLMVSNVDQLVVEPISAQLLQDYLNDKLNPGQNLVEDVNLPTLYTVGGVDYAITWTTSNEAVITPKGVVTRPEGEEDAQVTLTATITFSKDVQLDLTYEVNVPAKEGQVEEQTYVETFDTANVTDNYSTGSFVGVNNVVWNYANSRNEGLGTSDDYHIDGKGLMLRYADSYLEATIEGGVSSFSFEYRKAFTGTSVRQLELIITDADNNVTTIKGAEFGNASGADATVHLFVAENLNISGTFTVKIKNVGSGTSNKQITIDNITWTTYTQSLTQVKKSSKNELDNYVDLGNYSIAVGQKVLNVINNGKTLIDSANNHHEVIDALNNAKQNIDLLPTKVVEYNEAKTNLVLPTGDIYSHINLGGSSKEYITYIWRFNPEGIFDLATGAFTAPNVDTIVNIEVDILIDGVKFGETLTTIVTAKAPLNYEELYNNGVLYVNNIMASFGTDIDFDLELPTSHPDFSNLTFVWSSSHPEIIANDGKYTAPQGDTEVTLTVSILIDGEMYGADLTYNVNAKALSFNFPITYDFSKTGATGSTSLEKLETWEYLGVTQYTYGGTAFRASGNALKSKDDFGTIIGSVNVTLKAGGNNGVQVLTIQALKSNDDVEEQKTITCVKIGSEQQGIALEEQTVTFDNINNNITSFKIVMVTKTVNTILYKVVISLPN